MRLYRVARFFVVFNQFLVGCPSYGIWNADVIFSYMISNEQRRSVMDGDTEEGRVSKTSTAEHY